MPLVAGTGISPAPAAQTGSIEHPMPLVSNACPKEPAQRGVAILAVAQQGVSITEDTPSEVKLAVTGYGAARKEQVGSMVSHLLHLPAVPTPDDAADAAAIAICHPQTLCLYREGSLM